MSADPRQAMADAAKEVFGDRIPIELGPNGVFFPMGLGIGESGGPTTRPWASKIAHLRQNPPEATTFLNNQGTDIATRYVQSTLIRDAADELFKAKNYKDACMTYMRAAVVMIGRELPINGPFNLAEYARLDKWELADMLGCLSGAAESLVKLRQYKQVSLHVQRCIINETHRPGRRFGLRRKSRSS
jgi:hypothetical protein